MARGLARQAPALARLIGSWAEGAPSAAGPLGSSIAHPGRSLASTRGFMPNAARRFHAGFSAIKQGSWAQSSIPLSTGRPRLVVLGTGWGGARLARDIDPSKYDITVISPRNHMVFTPLLASTCVGTLEARSVTVPIVDIQPALKQPQNYYYSASCTGVFPDDNMVECVSEDGLRFFVEYDVLAISTGSQGSTFGIPGVEAHTLFLRDAANATALRTALIANWNRANIPGRLDVDRLRLLHVVVVGGGPTGVEFAGELADFVNRDLRKIDPGRARDMRITVVEAHELLGSFDARLREYAARKLVRAGVHLTRGVVKEVRHHELELQDGNVIPFGLCVWSTGVGPTDFTLSLPFVKTGKGRVAVDSYLRVLAPPKVDQAGHVRGPEEHGSGPQQLRHVSMVQEEAPGAAEREAHALHNVYALGDCCAGGETALPALAQVAEQQGKYLAAQLNAAAQRVEPPSEAPPPFVYRPLGSMATVGGRSAVLQLGDESRRWSMAGFTSWVAWRSAYLTRLGTVKHRLYVATNWTLTLLFGRDISRW